MCAITKWYNSTFSEDVPVGTAASKVIHKLEKLKSVGDEHALKELASLPWEEQSTLARIAIVRGMWSLTRVPDFRPHYVNLRDRVHASFVAEFSKERADYLLRGLYDPEFHKPFAEKLYAVSKDED